MDSEYALRDIFRGALGKRWKTRARDLVAGSGVGEC